MSVLALKTEDIAGYVTKLELRAHRAEEALAKALKDLHHERWKAITTKFVMDRLGKEVDQWRDQCQKME